MNPMNEKKFTKFCKRDGACPKGLAWIKGKSAAEFWDTCERGDWMEWLLNAIGFKWPVPAQAEYDRVTAPALAKYVRVTAAALRKLLGNPFREMAQ